MPCYPQHPPAAALCSCAAAVQEGAPGGVVGGVLAARRLARGGRLTPSLLIRSLCTGDMTFFEVALSHLAKVPILNARLLIHDGGKLGLKSLYEKAGLPPALLTVVRIAVEVAHETPFDGGDRDIERHSCRMIERILTQYEALEDSDIDYLLNKLGDLARPAA